MVLKQIGAIAPTAPQSSASQSRELSATWPADLVPIEPRELAVRLAHTLAPWPDAAPELMAQYREVLSDVPADLVEIALRHVLQTATWLPKPAELRAPIAKILEARQRRHADQIRRNTDHAQQLRGRDEWMASWPRPQRAGEDDRADHDTGRVLSAAEIHEHFARACPDG